MTSKRSWQLYPFTYRAREIATLAAWIQAGESGAIIGLPGGGKSNLLGFLCHRSEAIYSYLQDATPKLALVLVDLNNLPGDDLATFFRVILRALYEARTRVGALDEDVITPLETLYRRVEDKLDPFLTQSALREILLLFQQKDLRLVLVMDPFEQFCRTAPTQVLDNLRGLRDSFKTTLSYLVGLRHEVTYLRSPAELGELFEILDTHQCWVGAMESEDARWVIGQVEAATDHTFSETQIARLIDLTGGFPALLRAASLWLARVSPVPVLDDWSEQLLVESGIRNRLNDLRQGLTGEEESVLSIVQRAWLIRTPSDREESLRQIAEKYQAVLACLQIKRLCQPTEAGWRIFSPLLAKFIGNIEGLSAGKIQYDSTINRFLIGERELTGLSDRDRRLLQFFILHPRQANTIDTLIEAAWTDDEQEGVADEAVQQAIRHLRKQIEPNPAKPCYLVTERGAGYRFFPEGAPRG